MNQSIKEVVCSLNVETESCKEHEAFHEAEMLVDGTCTELQQNASKLDASTPASNVEVCAVPVVEARRTPEPVYSHVATGDSKDAKVFVETCEVIKDSVSLRRNSSECDK